MPEPPTPNVPINSFPNSSRTSVPSTVTGPSPTASAGAADKVSCERCSTEMFRMHAVWRCPNCGYKTDCCGW